MQHAEIVYDGVKEQDSYNDIINKVISECFKNEGLDRLKLYASITLTNSQKIRELNREYRNIDKETDVLSFPMFEPSEIEEMKREDSTSNILSELKEKSTEIIDEGNDYSEDEVLGDIVISISRVEEQAKEYGHSFERELAYMCVHSFYHLMGYDHMIDSDKIEMRAKEDEILNRLHITR